MSTLSQLAVSKRLTIVEKIGTPDDGESLAGQNVNDFPSGALFYVRSSHRLYELRKNLPSAVVATNANNVVDGIGSSAAAGRFVAVTQWWFGQMTAGSVAIAGFDLSSNGLLLASHQTHDGTVGNLAAVKTTASIATVTSTSNTDTSTVVVQWFEFPEP